MNYKLALELKEAGFPMPDRPKVWAVTKNHSEYENDLAYAQDSFVELPDKKAMFLPTLSELIEACGEDLSHIKKWNGHWWAVTHSRFDENGNNFEECALTPEEAVARLWLALNKK